ncbi:uncharacterized protein LOC143025788 [Oratosquilla oratoria]|uniref:uncharacterized protein LOC143025788 n=1 Tax=Oratosquilla oratoria TaxID=337810 RepID=UPI003F75DDB9
MNNKESFDGDTSDVCGGKQPSTPPLPRGPGGQGGLPKRSGHRANAGIGPPPRPFKKARYAWEIKNYEHTVNNMAQSMTDGASENNDDGQDSHSSDVNSEGSQEETLFDVQRESILAAQSQGLDPNMVVMDPHRLRGGPRADLIMPHEAIISNGPYPTPPYTAMVHAAAPPSVDADPSVRQNDLNAQQESQAMRPPADPDARLWRWHTRQICRSIFDNTVNRMLENMGFSPVTEKTQGLHPLLVLNLSDDEDKENDGDPHRTLESEALNVAIQQKGLFLPTYHFDPLESATTTDYDSSTDDSDLVDEAGSDDIQEAMEAHLDIAHMIPRPQVVSRPSQQTARSPHIPCRVPPVEVGPPPELCDESPTCDVELEKTKEMECVTQEIDEDEAVVETNSPEPEKCGETKESDDEEVTTMENEKCDEDHTSNGETGVDIPQADDESKTKPSEGKGESENNNNKYFLDQAIQMAINKQGLGYQKV